MAWRKVITWTNDDQVIETCRLTRPLWVKKYALSFSYCFINKNDKKRIIFYYAFVETTFATLLETYLSFLINSFENALQIYPYEISDF